MFPDLKDDCDVLGSKIGKAHGLGHVFVAWISDIKRKSCVSRDAETVDYLQGKGLGSWSPLECVCA